jgi:predicted Zn-dependent peptidase
MGQEVVERTLPSGLTVVMLRKPGFAQKFAALATNYGGMDSEFVIPGQSQPTQVPDGIAHFLEHKLFEEPDGSDISQRFSQMGMSTNAYTGSYYTVYHFTTVEHFDAGLDLLLHFVQNPHFTDESVAKEQGIIGQEIQMGLDSPSRMAYYNFMESMFHAHPARIRTIGSVESIARIDKELLHKCHDTFYHPSNMMLIVAGELDFDTVLSQVEKDLAARNYSPREAIKRIIPHEPDDVARAEASVGLKISRPRVMMGFKGRLSEDHADFHRRLIAADLALGVVLGRLNPNYWKMYEKGIITEGFRFGYSAYSEIGYVWIDGETENAHAFADEITKALQQARQEGLPADLFEAVRRQEIGAFLAMLDNPEQLAGAYITHRFNELDIMDARALLDEVSLDDGQSFLEQLIREDNRVISIVEPLKGAR